MDRSQRGNQQQQQQRFQQQQQQLGGEEQEYYEGDSNFQQRQMARDDARARRAHAGDVSHASLTDMHRQMHESMLNDFHQMHPLHQHHQALHAMQHQGFAQPSTLVQMQQQALLSAQDPFDSMDSMLPMMPMMPIMPVMPMGSGFPGPSVSYSSVSYSSTTHVSSNGNGRGGERVSYSSTTSQRAGPDGRVQTQMRTTRGRDASDGTREMHEQRRGLVDGKEVFVDARGIRADNTLGVQYYSRGDGVGTARAITAGEAVDNVVEVYDVEDDDGALQGTAVQEPDSVEEA